jgi:vacuolar-type H+-ATPase subunit I/STV1
MEFNLDFLKNTGNALRNIGKKDDDLIKVKDDEVVELSDKKKEDVSTTTVLENSGDASEAEKIYQKDEGVITTKDKEKESEDDLEKKLKNIEKVIETFSGNGGTTTISNTGKLPASVNLNQQPLDLGTTQAKQYQAEYLKPSTVPDDRIALLYEGLKKYNLI